MYKLARPLFLHCLSPLHAGTGSDLGYIDLPIQREKHTGFPKVEASSLKGALREIFEQNTDELQVPFDVTKKVNEKNNIDLSFGPESGDAHAGAIGFTDARLLLFPVKSLKGIFAWVTCPRVLEKFKSELLLCHNTKEKKELEDLANEVPSSSQLDNTISDLGLLGINGKVVLEEYAFTLTQRESVKKFATELNKYLKLTDLDKRLIILQNDEFTDFVKLHTEVITRIKIGDSGTAEGQALFNEEFLPAESVLYSLVLASPIFKEKDSDKGIFKENGGTEKDYEKLMQYFNQGLKDVFQLGGDATLGKGITKTIKTLLQ